MDTSGSALTKMASRSLEESEETIRKLAECAYEFPESRDDLAETLEAYAQKARTGRERARASSAAAEIRAITMLEILSSELEV